MSFFSWLKQGTIFIDLLFKIELRRHLFDAVRLSDNSNRRIIFERVIAATGSLQGVGVRLYYQTINT